MMRKAVVFGASGLVGGELMRQLLARTEVGEVIVGVRRELELEHPKLRQRKVDFGDLADWREALAGADVFCCLGTTIKIAKTKEAFRKVDYEYPLRIGEVCLDAGAASLSVISSIGADAGSGVFYSRTKGEMERDLSKLRLPKLTLLRPSLLLGDRREFRFGERAAALAAAVTPFLWIGPLRKYKPIHAREVAAALIRAAARSGGGMKVLESEELYSG